MPTGYARPSYFTYKAGCPSAALLRPSRPAPAPPPPPAPPAPPAPLPLRAEALPTERLQLQAEQEEVAVEEVAVGESGEELDRLLQEQLARIRGTWGQEVYNE